MELEYSIWQIGFIALVAGALIGALAYRFFAPSIKQADKVKSELDDARAELDNYKVGVSQHFDKTGELVNELAQNYVKVYKHLAEGAQALGAGKSFPELLEQQNKGMLDVDDEPGVVSSVTDDASINTEETVETQRPVDYVANPASEEIVDEANPENLKKDKFTAEVIETSEDQIRETEATESAQGTEATESAGDNSKASDQRI